MSLVGRLAPLFTLEGFQNGEFVSVCLEEFRGRWVYLLFYPLDFTFVCPTEVLAFSRDVGAFTAKNCQILGISVDSKYTHKAWVDAPRERGGLGGSLSFPLLSDMTKEVSRAYGVLDEASGVALRGLFLINPDGLVVHQTVNFLPVGRSAREALRLLKAFQYVSSHQNQVCPADWDEGKDTMVATPEGAAQYLATH